MKGIKIHLSSTKFLFAILLVLSATKNIAQVGTWSVLPSAPGALPGGINLLSDGTVMAKMSNLVSFAKLIPDDHGSYVNGHWVTIAQMNKERYPFSSQVLKSGKVYVAGSEEGYGINARTGIDNGEIYDPVQNTWTLIPGHNYGAVDDTLSVSGEATLLPDGSVLQGTDGDYSTHTTIYNPDSNSYSPGPSVLHDLNYCENLNEATWVKLPDGSILLVNNITAAFNPSACPVSSQRLIPDPIPHWEILNQDVPVNLYADEGEIGPAVLLPDGKAIFFGGFKTAIFDLTNLNGNPWTIGPDLPTIQDSGGNTIQLDAPDCSAALMPNGKVLIVLTYPVTGGGFIPGVFFYEYDYLTATFTPVPSPSAPAGTISSYALNYTLLNLPDGTVFVTAGGSKGFIYTPYMGDNLPLSTWKPTISAIQHINCSDYSISGTLFNGITEGAYFGDDYQMATNYPIVKLTNGTNAYYARTSNWNLTGVQQYSVPCTADFSVPLNLPAGTYDLTVIANGISSDPIPFIQEYSTAITADNITPCPGQSVTLSATGGSNFVWYNSSIGSNITVSPTITTTYSVTANDTLGCQHTASITINPVLLQITANADNTTICLGNAITLWGSGANSYAWSDGITDSVAFIPTNVGSTPAFVTYTVTGTSNGCSSTATVSFHITSLPITSTYDMEICAGTFITLSGGIQGDSLNSQNITFTWTGGITDGVPFAATTSSAYTVTGTDVNGCYGENTTFVTVNDLPIVIANASSTSICLNTPITLTASGNADSYSWDHSVLDNIPFTPNTSAVYTVTGTESTHNCSSTASVTVDVSLPPTATISGSSSICSAGGASSNSTSANLSVVFTGTGPWTYSINGVLQPVATSDTVIVNVVPTSTTTYSITAFNDINCTGDTSQSVTATITVNPVPDVTVSYLSGTSICSGVSPNIALGSSVAGTTFFWSETANSGIISGTAPTSSGATINEILTNTSNSSAGTIKYLITPIANSCSGNTALSQQITIKPTPIGVSTPSTDIVCDGFAPTFIQSTQAPGTQLFSWSASGTSGTSGYSTSTQTGAALSELLYNDGTVDVNGTVTYTVTPIAAGCEGSSYTVTATVTARASGSASASIICNGDQVYIPLINESQTTLFSWTANVTGGSLVENTGSGDLNGQDAFAISVTATNASNATDAVVNFNVTPFVGNCPGTPFDVPLTIHPMPNVTVIPSNAYTICSGTNTASAFTTTETNTTLSWTGNDLSGLGLLSGISSGGSATDSLTLDDVITNSGLVPYIAEYMVTPTSEYGCSDPIFNNYFVDVTVNPSPTATASSTPATCNPNGTATVSVTGGTAPYSNLWSTNDTASTISGLSAGSYSVTVTDINGCEGTASTAVINAPMIAPSICMVTVNDSSSHNIVLWDKTGMTNVMHFNIYREDATNVYSPIGTVPFDSLSRFVDYSAVADPNVTTKRYKISITDSCGNESALSNYHNTLYIADIGGGQYLWADLYTIENNPNPVIEYWLMRDSISGANNWQQVATTSGTQHVLNDPNYLAYPNADYRVSTLWNITCTPNGSSISTTQSNIKHHNSVQPFTLSPLVTDANCPGGCNGSADANPTGMQGPVTYLWLPTNDTSRTVTGLCEGVTYTVTATDGISTSTYTILIAATNSMPDLTTNIASLPAITANQVGASYQWLDCGAGNTALTGETNQTFTATVNGDYAVLVSVNGCADTSACVHVNSVGIEESNDANGINMYPNPAGENVTIEAEGGALQSIKVMNVLGKEVYQQEIQNRKAVLNLSSYAKGVYSVEINVQNNKVIKKLVIQ